MNMPTFPRGQRSSTMLLGFLFCNIAGCGATTAKPSEIAVDPAVRQAVEQFWSAFAQRQAIVSDPTPSWQTAYAMLHPTKRAHTHLSEFNHRCWQWTRSKSGWIARFEWQSAAVAGEEATATLKITFGVDPRFGESCLVATQLAQHAGQWAVIDFQEINEMVARQR